jgi:hypothetical protein
MSNVHCWRLQPKLAIQILVPGAFEHWSLNPCSVNIDNFYVTRALQAPTTQVHMAFRRLHMIVYIPGQTHKPPMLHSRFNEDLPFNSREWSPFLGPARIVCCVSQVLVNVVNGMLQVYSATAQSKHPCLVSLRDFTCNRRLYHCLETCAICAILGGAYTRY